MPGAALHDVVQRLVAVIGLQLRLRSPRAIAPPPPLEAGDFAALVALGARTERRA